VQIDNISFADSAAFLEETTFLKVYRIKASQAVKQFQYTWLNQIPATPKEKAINIGNLFMLYNSKQLGALMKLEDKHVDRI